MVGGGFRVRSSRSRGLAILASAAGIACALTSIPALAQPAGPTCREVDRSEYADRLRAMWLCECIGNWTGLKTEGRSIGPPFLTDADWRTTPASYPPFVFIDYIWNQNPWGADDDTDVEYVYLHLMDTLGVNRLSPEQIRQGWVAHINRAIWVSNASARQLMNAPGAVRPPMSAAAQGLAGWVNPPTDLSTMIDAQLTTEMFGALCPGMPERALAMADLPIRATATGYAVHAAQFYVVLYSLASQVDPALAPADKAVWLVREARKYIPDTSKSADVIDFVLDDYLSNPDKTDWARTRDRVAERYQTSAATHGFVYQAWYESSVNLATGLIALLYGNLDLPRTVQIGTLSGWDSDNGTATMSGLLGLIHGRSMLELLSQQCDRFWISRTRDNLPDHTPEDTDAEDTFTLMARRMLPIVDREVADAGGRVRVDAPAPDGGPRGAWLLPPGGAGPGIDQARALDRSPTTRLSRLSANLSVRAAGSTVIASCSLSGTPQVGVGSSDVNVIADGVEHDFAGLESAGQNKGFFSTQRAEGRPAAQITTLAVEYSRPVTVHTVRFIEGDHFGPGTAAGGGGAVEGGWFTSAAVELKVNGVWTPALVTQSEAFDPVRPFQIIDWVLATPTLATGVRITGSAGGSAAFVTCTELDTFAGPVALGIDPPAVPPIGPGGPWDLNADGVANVEDLYTVLERTPASTTNAAPNQPGDLNADGVIDATDVRLMVKYVRWNEAGRQ